MRAASETASVHGGLPVDQNGNSCSGNSSDSMNFGTLSEFFPGSSVKFAKQCGAVKTIAATDFEDFHRNRHLKSFLRSWNEWQNYDPDQRLPVEPQRARKFLMALVALEPKTPPQFEAACRAARRTTRTILSKSQMASVYHELLADGSIQPDAALEALFVKKVVRTHSGVLVITVLTSPGQFSCPHDCHYCPNEPGQPRSYLSTEPAVLRANQNGWDAALQFWDRCQTLRNNGHIVDKLEVLVLGGTWSGYPPDYQESFARDLFYAANTFPDFLQLAGPDGTVSTRGRSTTDVAADAAGFITARLRSRRSLEEEQQLNERAQCRIIGLTLETRPDKIDPCELQRLRRFGCTRVQIGVQHTHDSILRHINRGCSTANTIRALRLLKDACFKVDIHLMPDLPGSSPELDKAMFEEVLSSPELQADQWKIYPCEVTPFSQIEQWYENGRFLPYAEQHGGAQLVQLLAKVKTAVHPWIRLNRVIRDIPNDSIIAGSDRTNLRQLLLDAMARRNLRCRCLRCREIKVPATTAIGVTKNPQLVIRKYHTFGGEEYFLSYESANELKLFGFLRLRIRSPEAVLTDPHLCDTATFDLSSTFPELEQSALVRELHVYGQLVGCQEQKSQDDCRPQHSGLGRRLLCAAEIIASSGFGLRRIAVIAGIGTRDFYRRFGYQTEGYFMTKPLEPLRVATWASALDLHLPLVIQNYTLATDLGLLNHHFNVTDPLNPATNTAPSETVDRPAPVPQGSRKRNRRQSKRDDPVSPRGISQPGFGGGSSEPRTGRGLPLSNLNPPDVFSQFEGNCSAKLISYGTGTTQLLSAMGAPRILRLVLFRTPFMTNRAFELLSAADTVGETDNRRHIVHSGETPQGTNRCKLRMLDTLTGSLLARKPTFEYPVS